MERQIEIIPFLSRVVQENTHAYQEDFDYDVRKITRAVQESNMEDRTFYWMSRPCGTWCVKERNVFLRETEEHAIWTYYESSRMEYAPTESLLPAIGTEPPLEMCSPCITESRYSVSSRRRCLWPRWRSPTPTVTPQS